MALTRTAMAMAMFGSSEQAGSHENYLGAFPGGYPHGLRAFRELTVVVVSDRRGMFCRTGSAGIPILRRL